MIILVVTCVVLPQNWSRM